MRRRVVVSIALSLGAAGVGIAAPAVAETGGKFGPQVAAVAVAAEKEGKLQLSWSGSGFGNNGRDLPHWIDAFNRFYGTKLAYTFTPAPTMTQQVAAIVQSTQSGTPAASDDIILGADNMVTAIDAHATRAYDWAELAKEIGVALPRDAVAPGNAGVAFATAVFGITYNRNAVSDSEVPHSLDAALKPQWKGRIAGEPHAAGFAFLAAFDPHWGPAKTEDYVRKLSRQIGGLMRCGDAGALLSGQFDMQVMDCDIASDVREERQGIPLGYVVPTDAPLTDPWYMAVPKNSPDPAAGALLALFMLTKEGQALSWDSDGNDLAFLPGSHTAKVLPAQPTSVIVQDYSQQHDAVKYYDQYTKILTSMAGK